MKKTFVPFDKMSKKQRKEYLKEHRLPPIPAPKTIPDKHKEQRDKEREQAICLRRYLY